MSGPKVEAFSATQSRSPGKWPASEADAKQGRASGMRRPTFTRHYPVTSRFGEFSLGPRFRPPYVSATSASFTSISYIVAEMEIAGTGLPIQMGMAASPVS